MENMTKCPGCSQHCDKNNLQCGKGEAIFNGELNPDSVQTHSRHESGHHGQRGEGCCGRHEGGHYGQRGEGCCGRHEGGHDHREGKGCGRHDEKGHGHRRPEFAAGSLAELLAKCGHRLFHGGDESMFAALTDEESATLKMLLSKLLGN